MTYTTEDPAAPKNNRPSKYSATGPERHPGAGQVNVGGYTAANEPINIIGPSELHEEWGIKREADDIFPERIITPTFPTQARAVNAMGFVAGVFQDATYVIVHRWVTDWEVVPQTDS